MSKELEALQDLSRSVFVYGGLEQYKIIETALKRLEELEKEWEMEHTLRIRLENIVYEKSEVLQIIKEKKVDLVVLEKCKSVREYNEDLREEYRLTKREFDLLKEWLK